jgi:hypothetical protein
MMRLADIFSKDPLSLTKDDYDAIGAHYREFRGQFARIKKDGSVKKDRKPRAKKATEPQPGAPFPLAKGVGK